MKAILKKGFTLTLVLITIMSFAVTPVSAAQITVGEESTNDYSSIQDAVDNALDGDTIVIANGTYYESVNVTTANLTFKTASGVNQSVVVAAHKSHANGNGSLAFDTSAVSGVTVDTNISQIDAQTVTVNASSTTGNYSTIQNATDNVVEGTVISIDPDTYNESVNVTTNYLYFKSSSTTENVTIDAQNTSTGIAIDDANAEGIFVGDNVKMLDAALGGSGGNTINADILGDTFFGIPLWAYLIVVIALVGLYYREQN